MADQTIDAIKVRLGVDTSSVEAGVRAANTELDKLGSKTRVVRVRVEAVRTGENKGGWESVQTYLKKQRADAAKGFTVPVSITAKEEGQLGVGKMREKINAALAKGGGVNVPIKVTLTGAEAKAIRDSISLQISPVKIYFDWVARNPPGHPPGTTNVGTDPGPRGGAGGGGASAAGGATFQRGRRPGETRKAASDRHKAEHAAEQAEKRADQAATKAAEGRAASARKETERTQARAGATPDAGPAAAARPVRTETQQRLDAEIGRNRKIIKDQEALAAKTESTKVRERAQRKVERARAAVQELEVERRAEAKAVREARRAAAPAPTPAATPAAEPLGGTGSRPRQPTTKTATGAPATGEASGATTAPRPAGTRPGTGPISARAGRTKGYRTSDRPRGFGADFDYAPGTSPATTGSEQGQIETQRQRELAEAYAEYAAQMKAEGVSAADPEAAKGFIARMKGSARRRMSMRLGPPGAEGDPLTDPDVLAAWLGKAQEQAEIYAAKADISGGRTATRMAGARKGGRAGGGGDYTGTRGGKAPKGSPRGAAQKASESATALDVTGSSVRGIGQPGGPVDVSENPLATVSFAGLDIRPPGPEDRPKDFREATPAERAKMLRAQDAQFRAEYAAVTAAGIEPDERGFFSWKGRTFTSRDALQQAIARSGPQPEEPTIPRRNRTQRRAGLQPGAVPRLPTQTPAPVPVGQPVLRARRQRARARQGSGLLPWQIAAGPYTRPAGPPLPAGVVPESFGQRATAVQPDLPEFAFSPRKPGTKLTFRGPLKPDEMAEGGLYSRKFGEKIAAEGHRNVATENSYEWKKLRGQILRRQPYCAHCGIGIPEARRTGIKMSVDKIVSQAAGGNPWDPSNLQTLCSNCNSRKAHMSGNPAEIWTQPRPGFLTRHPKFAETPTSDFLPGGKLFGVTGIADALKRVKRKAEGGKYEAKVSQPRPPREEIARWLKSQRLEKRLATEREDPYEAGRHYDDRPFGRAEGGEVKHTGLLGRMAQAGHQPSVTLLGERGPELAVSDPGTGQTEIVPTHKVPTWLQRAREGKGFAKDLTGRADGGQPGFTFRGRTGFTSTPGRVVNAQGMISRVFVVNWPAAMQAAGGQPAQAAAGANIGQIVNAINQGFNRAAGAAGGGRRAAGGGGGGGGAGGSAGAAGGGAGAGGGGGGGAGAAPAFGPGVGRARGTGIRGRFYERQLELSDIQSQISEAQSLTPVRALSVSFGQITSQLTGRADIQARARRAARLTTQAESALRAEQGERDKLAQMLRNERNWRRAGAQASKKEQDALLTLPAEIKRQRELVARANRTAETKQATAGEAAGGIITTGAAVKNILAGAAGISVGTLAFSTAYGALNASIQTFTDVAGKAIERGSGYRNVMATVTKELGETTRAQNGAVDSTVALAEAHAGLSANVARSATPALRERAIIEGGNVAFDEQLNLLRSATQIRREEALGAAGFRTGPGQPQGGIPGITRATGGAFGSPLNATPSLFEQVSSAAGVTPMQQVLRGASEALFGRNNEQAKAFFGAGEVRTAAEIGEAARAGVPPQDLIAMSQPLMAFSDTVETMQGSLEKVNSQFEIIGQSSQKWSKDIQKASNQALILAGVDAKLVETFNKTNVAFINRQTGEAISGRADVKAFGEDVLRGGLIPDPKLLIKALSDRILPAQLGGIRREGTFERESLIPQQVAMRRIATPLVPFNDPRLRPNAGVGSIPLGTGGEDYRKAFEAYADTALPAQKAITAEIAKGRTELEKMGVPSAMLDDIGAIGKQIQDIQLGLSQRGLNLQVAEYNNQLRISNRSLRDARDFMAGIRGEAGNTLGALEGQNTAMSRQLQLLQFELSQRQINFKLATAGFVAPGTTPEERAARIEAAKVEADYAQRQLDLQKQIATNQYKTVGISAGRNITDLQAQIDLLTQGRGLTIDSAAAQASIEALQEQQDILIQKAQSYSNQGQKIAALYMNTWTDIETQSGQFMVGLGTDLASAFEKAGAAFVKSIRIVTDPRSYYPDGGKEGPGTSGGWSGARNAPGYTGYHATPTQMTIGEAGGEEVAILRNPRRMLFSGGGGGGGIDVGGITVIVQGSATQENAASLAAEIARKVEENLMRKTSLFGLRRA